MRLNLDSPAVRDLLDKARNALTMAEAASFLRKARLASETANV